MHTTNLLPWRNWISYVVVERPELFAAYQSVHSDLATATLRGRSYALSFVPLGDRMVLAGFFKVRDLGERPVQEIYGDPRFGILEVEFGATDTTLAKAAHRSTQTVFGFEPQEPLRDLIGRLMIGRPQGRTYVRLAVNLDADVLAISEESSLRPPPPHWRNFIISAPLLRSLPRDWSARLREWRGVYLIVDETDGARYVGSAYGEENLLGRWQAHVSGEVGVTAQLRKRKTANFRFSILQLLTHDAEPGDVIRIEQNWMDRLHTRVHGLNA